MSTRISLIPAEGGDALLYQHMFWFFGHPEVYIIFIPATGFISHDGAETFSGRRIFGYTAMVLSLIATAFIGFGLWVHHMFATPIPSSAEAFSPRASMMIAIPSGIQIFCWLATLWSWKTAAENRRCYLCVRVHRAVRVRRLDRESCWLRCRSIFRCTTLFSSSLIFIMC